MGPRCLRKSAGFLAPSGLFEPGGRGPTAVAFSGFGDRAEPDRTSVLLESLPGVPVVSNVGSGWKGRSLPVRFPEPNRHSLPKCAWFQRRPSSSMAR
jgi:hypothetical protein